MQIFRLATCWLLALLISQSGFSIAQEHGSASTTSSLKWIKQGSDGAAVSKEELLHRIETHVQTVVRRYHETATMWDVVNEALADGSEGYLRDSIYSRTTGIEFIESAFRTADKNDPGALLIYNDYNCHFPDKRKKLIRLLTELKERGVPVDAYGMQGRSKLAELLSLAADKLSVVV